jgi:hypothetical protein
MCNNMTRAALFRDAARACTDIRTCAETTRDGSLFLKPIFSRLATRRFRALAAIRVESEAIVVWATQRGFL